MKKLLLIGIPLIIIGYCLLSITTNFVGLGPLDNYPRTLQYINCQNGIEAKVYRHKFLYDLLNSTDNRIRIKKGNIEIFNDRLLWADIWSDIEPKDVMLECQENKIRVFAKTYFDNTYQIISEKEIIKEKKYTW